MGFIRNLLTGGKGFRSATNYLMVEYMLQTHMLNTQQKMSIGYDVLDILLEGFNLPRSESKLAAMHFNNKSRFIQLNIVAMALDKSKTSPPFKNEFWFVPKNPFSLKYDERDTEAVLSRLESSHSVKIQMDFNRLRLEDFATGID